MGLFHRNENDANFAGGSRNIVESIQRQLDVDALIYIDQRQDFNMGSVITVAPNEQVIFIKNGILYGVLPSGRHVVATDNIPVLGRIRNMLSGGMSTFTCQVYHVTTSMQTMKWGTEDPIQCVDYHYGDGVPTDVIGNGDFQIYFDIDENDNAAAECYKKLMGGNSVFTSEDLKEFFKAQITQRIGVLVAQMVSDISRTESINTLYPYINDITEKVTPKIQNALDEFGIRIHNFSFNSLQVVDSEERMKLRKRLNAAKYAADPKYGMAVQQEILENISVNPGAGGVASAGAGLGLGMAAGNAFATMATTAFAQPQPQQFQQPMGFGGGNRFGAAQAQPTNSSMTQDPADVLVKMKKLLDSGLISQQQYDDKVAEVLSRM